MAKAALKVSKVAQVSKLNDDDHELLASVCRQFDGKSGGPFFTTDVSGLWDLFIATIPERLRQTYTCHACRQFVERFGGLVTIDDAGVQSSALWGDGPGVFGKAVAAMASAVENARVNGVFLAKDPTWGIPVTGEWHHFAVTPPKPTLYRHPLLTPSQAMAEKVEDYGMLSRALAEFSLAVARNAQTVADSDHLYRGEKVAGVAKWFRDLHESRAATKNKRSRENLAWRSVAAAPPGFCHVRTTMLGTVLEDLSSGLPVEAVKARFAEKMHPLKYQRPTTQSAGNIEQAEKIVAKLGIAASLRRRFARLEEVVSIWRPKAPESKTEKSGGVFDHLKTEKAAAEGVDLPAVTMTWEKFARTVLPTADRIEFLAVHASYISLTTAADPEAPPILQWDSIEQRNPVAWYFYNGGSSAQDFNLRNGSYVEVSALCQFPPAWYGVEREHQGQGIIFLLNGARDMRRSLNIATGNALFPECLRSELHAVRSTIEAFSRSAKLEGLEEGTAFGLGMSKGARWPGYQFRVTSGSNRAVYRLDRWD